jgi:hypothetical protein
MLQAHRFCARRHLSLTVPGTEAGAERRRSDVSRAGSGGDGAETLLDVQNEKVRRRIVHRGLAVEL